LSFRAKRRRRAVEESRPDAVESRLSGRSRFLDSAASRLRSEWRPARNGNLHLHSAEDRDVVAIPCGEHSRDGLATPERGELLRIEPDAASEEVVERTLPRLSTGATDHEDTEQNRERQVARTEYWHTNKTIDVQPRCLTAQSFKRREVPDGAKCRTARNPRRRGIPNGAESRTARNPERRGIPNGAESRTATKGGTASRGTGLLQRFSKAFSIFTTTTNRLWSGQ